MDLQKQMLSTLLITSDLFSVILCFLPPEDVSRIKRVDKSIKVTSDRFRSDCQIRFSTVRTCLKFSEQKERFRQCRDYCFQRLNTVVSAVLGEMDAFTNAPKIVFHSLGWKRGLQTQMVPHDNIRTSLTIGGNSGWIGQYDLKCNSLILEKCTPPFCYNIHKIIPLDLSNFSKLATKWLLESGSNDIVFDIDALTLQGQRCVFAKISVDGKSWSWNVRMTAYQGASVSLRTHIQ